MIVLILTLHNIVKLLKCHRLKFIITHYGDVTPAMSCLRLTNVYSLEKTVLLNNFTLSVFTVELSKFHCK